MQGDEIELHPDAQKVLDILDTESKADLLLFAKAENVPEDEVRGLSARDLRKALLARFAGLTT